MQENKKENLKDTTVKQKRGSLLESQYKDKFGRFCDMGKTSLFASLHGWEIWFSKECVFHENRKICIFRIRVKEFDRDIEFY